MAKFSKKTPKPKKLGAETETEDSIRVTFSINGLSYEHVESLVKASDGHSEHYLLGWKRIIEKAPKLIFPMIKKDNQS